MRIVVLLSRMESAREVIGVAARKAERLKAGVTLLYVREEKLFELPIFSDAEPSLEGIRERLEELILGVRQEGDAWALLVYDNDPVDHLLLEAEREKAALLITDLSGEARTELIGGVRTSLLLLEAGRRHDCEKGLAVFDPAATGSECLATLRRVLGARAWSAYMDYQVIPSIGTDLSLDPMVDTLNIDVELEQKLMEGRKKAFLELCEKEGINGIFEVGEAGLVEDILVRADLEEAECLGVIVEDHETLLAEGLGELSQRVHRDLMICFRQA